jgi:hypothetical protein
MTTQARRVSTRFPSGESTYATSNVARWSEFVQWRTSSAAVLDQVVDSSSLLRKTVDGWQSIDNKPAIIEGAVAFLRSVKRELEDGMLDSIASRIEAEVTSDYLEQAVHTLAGSTDEPNHIAAAVIAGAALERNLRTICMALSPAEPVTNPKGARLGMNGLVDALKRRGAINELEAKKLRAWAALRNHAAHGEFHEFDRPQVESMVAGVQRFAAKYSHGLAMRERAERIATDENSAKAPPKGVG